MTRPADAPLPAAPTASARRPVPHRLHPSVLTAVAVGGALGAASRYELALAVPERAGHIPWTTLSINIGGTFVLGLLLTFVFERWPPTRYVRPLFAIGFLGAFTTFSTFAVELNVLIKDVHVGVALIYVVISLIGGLAAAYAGIVVGRAWPALKRRTR